MVITPIFLAIMLGLIFAFIVDVSFNIRRVNKNIMKLIKKYEGVHGAINK